MDFPEKIPDEKTLEELLSKPSAVTVDMFKRLDGDIIFLGIAGKIGPSLAQMAKRACEEAGVKKKIYGVSRFSSAEEIQHIKDLGIEVMQGDLLDQEFLHSLPKVKNVFFLAGLKFGAEIDPSLTWAMNTFLPALVAEHFSSSRIVAYSTGCVYPLVSVASGGSQESHLPEPIGEYAQSCLGRERLFEYGSLKNKTPVVLIRLNYAVELRYGVLVDIAAKVKNQQPIDLSMGYFNVIWQGDANDMVLRSIELADSPARILNVSGPEILSLREVAAAFGKRLGKKPILEGKEAETALLNNSSQVFDLMGKPSVPVDQVMQWVAHWILEDKKLLGKPTHFQVRDGKY